MIFYIGVGVLTVILGYWIWSVHFPKYRMQYERVYEPMSEELMESYRNRFLPYPPYSFKDVPIGKKWEREEFYETWWTAMLGFIGIVLVWSAACGFWVLILGFVQQFTPWSLESSNKAPLVALSTDSKVEGYYGRGIFISRGYIDEKQTFNFLYEKSDGGVKLDYSLAEDSVIYQDAQESPYRTEYIWGKYNPWISPVSMSASYSYDFHVPEGSVAEGYEVKP